MEDTEKHIKPKTLWHDWFGNLFKVSLIPTGLDVETNVPVMQKLPEADIVIIRRSGKRWTNNQLQYLPDGIRHTRAKHVLKELKYTESINTDAFCQIAGYYKFYKIQQKLNRKSEIKCFLVSSKTPRNTTLKKYKYRKTRYSGVYRSQSPIFELFQIISLNDLSNTPFNILFKLFASKKKETIDATKRVKSDLYDQLPGPLQNFLTDYITRYLTSGGIDMDYLNMSQQEKMRLRQEWLSQFTTAELLSNRSPSEVLSNYSPSEVLSNYSPSEVLSNYAPSEVLSNYAPSEVLSNYAPSEVLSNYAPSEILSNYTTDQIISGLSSEQLKALSKTINAENQRA
jgi:hypothetical protein